MNRRVLTRDPKRPPVAALPDALVWHYTIAAYLDRIAVSGFLMPATAFVPPGEKPILWFSANPDWEPTANKALLGPDGRVTFGTRETTREHGGGLARFGYWRKRLHPWPKIARKARLSQDESCSLETSARAQGSNPAHWYGTTLAVPLDRIHCIEIEVDGAWVPLPRAEG